MSSVELDGSVTVSAKISDFGLALRAMPQPTGRGWDMVWAPPRGTPLYMAPELYGEQNERGCVQVGDADFTSSVTSGTMQLGAAESPL